MNATSTAFASVLLLMAQGMAWSSHFAQGTGPARSEQATPAQRLEDLLQRYRAIQEQYWKDLDACGEDEARIEALIATKPGAEMAPEFKALAEESLTRILERAPIEGVRGAALFSLACIQLSDPVDTARARSLFERLASEYGALNEGGRTYEDVARGYLFELDRLPFALLGINSDGPAESVRKVVADLGIIWRQAVDVDTRGPWATKWNVNSWPTIYILDKEGVIRFRNLRDQELEDAVLKLLAKR